MYAKFAQPLEEDAGEEASPLSLSSSSSSVSSSSSFSAAASSARCSAISSAMAAAVASLCSYPSSLSHCPPSLRARSAFRHSAGSMVPRYRRSSPRSASSIRSAARARACPLTVSCRRCPEPEPGWRLEPRLPPPAPWLFGLLLLLLLPPPPVPPQSWVTVSPPCAMAPRTLRDGSRAAMPSLPANSRMMRRAHSSARAMGMSLPAPWVWGGRNTHTRVSPEMCTTLPPSSHTARSAPPSTSSKSSVRLSLPRHPGSRRALRASSAAKPLTSNSSTAASGIESTRGPPASSRLRTPAAAAHSLRRNDLADADWLELRDVAARRCRIRRGTKRTAMRGSSTSTGTSPSSSAATGEEEDALGRCVGGGPIANRCA
mmetsp:Transcript_8595/g.21673  ORF Transcript_8595/g.21673 Transcript_8595/m.21673 type:complete len:373 (-) Transcript_8595:781-1899(-)